MIQTTGQKARYPTCVLPTLNMVIESTSITPDGTAASFAAAMIACVGLPMMAQNYTERHSVTMKKTEFGCANANVPGDEAVQ